MENLFQSNYRSECERCIASDEKRVNTRDNDAMIILPLILLLMTEKTDKMLLFALLYILM